jgi:hypothetical protein
LLWFFPILVSLFQFLVFCYSKFRCFLWPLWRVYLLVHFRCVLRGPLSTYTLWTSLVFLGQLFFPLFLLLDVFYFWGF